MSEFDHLLGRGFDLLVSKTNAPTIATKYGSVELLGTPLAISKDMMEKGFWPQFNAVVEIKRVDYLRLRIEDRTVLTYRATGPIEVELRVIGIEDDGADPCVKLTLKAEPGGKTKK